MILSWRRCCWSCGSLTNNFLINSNSYNDNNNNNLIYETFCDISNKKKRKIINKLGFSFFPFNMIRQRVFHYHYYYKTLLVMFTFLIIMPKNLLTYEILEK